MYRVVSEHIKREPTGETPLSLHSSDVCRLVADVGNAREKSLTFEMSSSWRQQAESHPLDGGVS